jgi:hypothetical protein
MFPSTIQINPFSDILLSIRGIEAKPQILTVEIHVAT